MHLMCQVGTCVLGAIVIAAKWRARANHWQMLTTATKHLRRQSLTSARPMGSGWAPELEHARWKADMIDRFSSFVPRQD